ncbi:MAG: site-specific integrase [Bacillota bacterium]|nr:site-specific integrase [Bacillota bacterium]
MVKHEYLHFRPPPQSRKGHLTLPSNYPGFLPAYIAVNTGLRMGEVLGLRWQDIDFKRETLTVKQTLQTVNREIRIRPKAKTKGSQRTIDLPKNLIQELKKHRLEQKKNMLAFGELYQKQYDLVCCKEDGSPIKSSSFGSYFVSMAKRCGLDISFHALRHTHASLLIKAGVHPKVISERLGHSNIGITMDLYGHLMQGMQKEAANRIDNIITGMNFSR